MSNQINKLEIDKDLFILLINEILYEILLQIKSNHRLLESYTICNWNLNKLIENTKSLNILFNEELILHLIYKCCEIIDLIFSKNIDKDNDIINQISLSFHNIILNSDYILIIVNLIRDKVLLFKNSLNMIFDKDTYKLNSLNWNIQSLLTSKDENYFNKKFSKIELSLSKFEDNETVNFNMVLLPNDIKILFKEIEKIKESLYLIKSNIN